MVVNKKIHSSDLFKALLNSTPYANIFINTDGSIIYYNEKANEFVSDISNIKLKKGKKLYNYVKEKVTFSLLRKLFLAYTGTISNIIVNFEINNKIEYFNVEFYPYLNSYDQLLGISINCINITEYINTERTISNLKQNILDLSWKNSHLIRSHVANLIGFSSLLTNRLYKIKEEERLALLEAIKSESNKLDIVVRKVIHDNVV